MALLLAGCAYKVRFESHPHGALLTVDDDRSYTLPAEVPLRWRPFERPRATVEAPGYRTLELRISPRHMRAYELVGDPILNPVEAFGDVPRRVIVIHLVPEHGPAGTWSPEDVP